MKRKIIILIAILGTLSAQGMDKLTNFLAKNNLVLACGAAAQKLKGTAAKHSGKIAIFAGATAAVVATSFTIKKHLQNVSNGLEQELEKRKFETSLTNTMSILPKDLWSIVMSYAIAPTKIDITQMMKSFNIPIRDEQLPLWIDMVSANKSEFLHIVVCPSGGFGGPFAWKIDCSLDESNKCSLIGWHTEDDFHWYSRKTSAYLQDRQCWLHASASKNSIIVADYNESSQFLSKIANVPVSTNPVSSSDKGDTKESDNGDSKQS